MKNSLVVVRRLVIRSRIGRVWIEYLGMDVSMDRGKRWGGGVLLCAEGSGSLRGEGGFEGVVA